MNTETLYHLLDRVGNLLRNEVRADLAPYGLQPIHLEALYYLSICNRFSDTPKAVTEYLGLTKGTVSQSLKVLETKGYIDKQVDSVDKRVTHLTVSSLGKKLVADIFPPSLMHKTINSGQNNQANMDVLALQQQLQYLLRSIQKENHLQTFGVCSTCRYNRPLADGAHLCGLTNLALSTQEIELICIEHIDSEPQ